MTPLIAQKAGALAQAVTDDIEYIGRTPVETAMAELLSALRVGDAPIHEALRQTALGLKHTLWHLPAGALHDPVSAAHLHWMCEVVLNEKMPADKASRWIGYIQGVMAMQGWLDVDVERDRTRPFFHAAYKATGHEIPPTRNGQKVETITIIINGVDKTLLRGRPWLTYDEIAAMAYPNRTQHPHYDVVFHHKSGVSGILGRGGHLVPLDGLKIDCYYTGGA